MTLHSQSSAGIRNTGWARGHHVPVPAVMSGTNATAARADEDAMIEKMIAAGMIKTDALPYSKPKSRAVQFEERRRGIVEFVRSNGVCRVPQIKAEGEALHITCDDNIRRDLRALVKQGLLTRERDIGYGKKGAGYVYQAVPHAAIKPMGDA